MSNKGFSSENAKSDSETNGIENFLNIDDLKFEKITLGDLGCNFAHGIFFEGDRLTEFELIDLDGHHFQRLGRLLGQVRNGKAFSTLCNFLADQKSSIVRTIGGISTPVLASQLGYNEASQMFRNMVFGDFLILLDQIRIKNAGNEIAISENCPNCGTLNEDNPQKGRAFHDLSTLEVNTIKDLSSPLRVSVTLHKGVKTGSDEICNTLLLKPLTVAGAEEINSPKNRSDSEDVQLTYKIVCGIPGSKWYGKAGERNVFGPELFATLTPRDIGMLNKACGKMMELGASLKIENDCYNCGHEWESVLQLGDLKNFLFLSADSTI